jgi:hypothetical protein
MEFSGFPRLQACSSNNTFAGIRARSSPIGPSWNPFELRKDPATGWVQIRFEGLKVLGQKEAKAWAYPVKMEMESRLLQADLNIPREKMGFLGPNCATLVKKVYLFTSFHKRIRIGPW